MIFVSKSKLGCALLKIKKILKIKQYAFVLLFIKRREFLSLEHLVDLNPVKPRVPALLLRSWILYNEQTNPEFEDFWYFFFFFLVNSLKHFLLFNQQSFQKVCHANDTSLDMAFHKKIILDWSRKIVPDNHSGPWTADRFEKQISFYTER